MAAQRVRHKNPNSVCSYYKKAGHTRERCFSIICYQIRNNSNFGSNYNQNNKSQFQSGYRVNRSPVMNNVCLSEGCDEFTGERDRSKVNEDVRTTAFINVVSNIAYNGVAGSSITRLHQVDQLLPKVDQLISLLKVKDSSVSANSVLA